MLHFKIINRTLCLLIYCTLYFFRSFVFSDNV